MPLHRSTHADVTALVAQLEADGETVVSIATDDGGVYVATVKKPKIGRTAKGVETR